MSFHVCLCLLSASYILWSSLNIIFIPTIHVPHQKHIFTQHTNNIFSFHFCFSYPRILVFLLFSPIFQSLQRIVAFVIFLCIKTRFSYILCVFYPFQFSLERFFSPLYHCARRKKNIWIRNEQKKKKKKQINVTFYKRYVCIWGYVVVAHLCHLRHAIAEQ